MKDADISDSSDKDSDVPKKRKESQNDFEDQIAAPLKQKAAENTTA